MESVSGTIRFDVAGAWSFGPSLTIPALSHRRRSAQISEAHNNVLSAIFDWEEALISAVIEVESSQDEIQWAQRRLTQSELAVRNLARAFNGFQELSAIGEATIVEALEVEREVFTARTNFESAFRALLRRQALILPLTGYNA